MFVVLDPAANPMPAWHSTLEQYLVRRAPVTLEIAVGFYHPSIDAAYAAGEAIPATHPSVQALFAGDLPPGHVDVDDLLRGR